MVAVCPVGLPRLAGSRRWEIVFLNPNVIAVVVDFAQRRPVGGASVRGRGCLAGTNRRLLHGADRGAGNSGVGGHLLAELALDALFDPPFTEDTLVDVKPVLLGADDHTGAHEAHKGNDLVSREAMAVDEVCTNEAACSSEAGLAVDSDAFLLDGDGLVCQSDEFANGGERWAGAVVEDHVEMRDAH